MVYSGSMEANMQSVNSSNVAEIGYNPDEQILVVAYHNGGVYNYYDVSPREYQSLEMAESKGRWIAQNIKGHKSYQRV